MEPQALPDSLSQPLQNLQQCLDEGTLDTLARQSGFVVRTARKLTALLTFKVYVLACALPLASFRNCAVLAGLFGGFTLSKQALGERIGPAARRFLELCLAEVLTRRLHDKQDSDDRPLPGSFKRVLILDSTTIALPQKWAALFPGSRNQCRGRGAQLKIQAVLDLCVHRFVGFAITPFTTNDQSAAGDAALHARPGDLWLRDLGYFTLGSFRQIAAAGAFFLSRFRQGTGLYDREGNSLKLLDMLRGRTRVDREVLLGKDHRLPVRLLAVRLPEPVAAERRRKARANRDRRLKPDPAYLEALGWAIFITNVEEQTLSLEQAVELYRLRWRIETVFKCWKSNFSMDQLPREVSTEQLFCLLIGRLIYCVLFEVLFTLWWFGDSHPAPACSHFKLGQLYRLMLPVDLLARAVTADPEAWARQIHYHCRYEKRRRLNFIQRLDALT